MEGKLDHTAEAPKKTEGLVINPEITKALEAITEMEPLVNYDYLGIRNGYLFFAYKKKLWQTYVGEPGRGIEPACPCCVARDLCVSNEARSDRPIPAFNPDVPLAKKLIDLGYTLLPLGINYEDKPDLTQLQLLITLKTLGNKSGGVLPQLLKASKMGNDFGDEEVKKNPYGGGTVGDTHYRFLQDTFALPEEK